MTDFVVIIKRFLFFRKYLSSNDGGLESIFSGLVNDVAYQIDMNVVFDLQNNLPGSGPILLSGKNLRDLASINIQRGRDHGIPSYKKYAEMCGLGPINDWADLYLFNYNAIIQLMENYE